MVYRNIVRMTLIALLIVASAYGETINTTDYLSMNGTIKEVTATTITLEGKFGSETKTFTIPRNKVISIDINSSIFNPKAPSKTPGLGPLDNNKKNPQPQVSQKDAIVLRKNIQKHCNLLGIDASTIHCQDSDYLRNDVLRILVGGGL